MFDLYYNFLSYVTGSAPEGCVSDLATVYKFLRASPRRVFFSASRMYYFDKKMNRPTYTSVGSRSYERLYKSAVARLATL